MPDAMPLDEVVAAARRGSTDAYGELWARLAPQIVGYLRGHRVPDAEDMTSEVFLTCFRNIRTFSGDGEAFRRLLFIVARRRYIDSVRRSVTAGPATPYHPDTDPREAVSAEDAAMAAMATDSVVEALQGLTEAQRDVLLLRLVGDLTIEQVAVSMGKPVGAVKQLQRRGLETLRRTFSDGPYPFQAVER